MPGFHLQYAVGHPLILMKLPQGNGVQCGLRMLLVLPDILRMPMSARTWKIVSVIHSNSACVTV